MNLEAKDWFRCRLYETDEYAKCVYSWDAFVRHVVYVTNIQGSALYDASLGDPALVDQMFDEMVQEQSSKRKKLREDSEEEIGTPPRRGYSREVEAIYDLTDNIVALRAEMGRWPRTQTSRMMSRRPLFPAEAARQRMDARAKKRRDAAIAAAQARYSANDREQP